MCSPIPTTSRPRTVRVTIASGACGPAGITFLRLGPHLHRWVSTIGPLHPPVQLYLKPTSTDPAGINAPAAVRYRCLIPAQLHTGRQLPCRWVSTIGPLQYLFM